MPQRTNDFQQVVDLIHRLFALMGASVTILAMVKTANGSEREIDVLVEYETDLYPEKLGEDYHRGSIVEIKTKNRLRNPHVWVGRILDEYLGQEVKGLYKVHEGDTIHVFAEIKFENHMVEAKGRNAICLKEIVLDFGEKMVIPKLEANVLKLQTDQSKFKRMVHEKGAGKNATVNLIYEDSNGPSPGKFQLHIEPKNGVPKVKTIIIELDKNGRWVSSKFSNQLLKVQFA